jgi:hypothetical protein
MTGDVRFTIISRYQKISKIACERSSIKYQMSKSTFKGKILMNSNDEVEDAGAFDFRCHHFSPANLIPVLLFFNKNQGSVDRRNADFIMLISLHMIWFSRDHRFLKRILNLRCSLTSAAHLFLIIA